MTGKRRRIARRTGRMRGDLKVLRSLMLGAIALGGWSFLLEHPQHNPWAPLDLRDPAGFATVTKLNALRSDPQQCRAVLRRSDIAFETLDPAGNGNCVRQDRIRLNAFPYAGRPPITTCPVAAAMAMWLDRSVRPAAIEHFGEDIAEIVHYGAYSCRRLYGRTEGRWSEHATGNAIDIAGFVLDDGTR
ncbi:MAG: extensin family protein, partial [Pontixanthobacter sp.]